MYIIYNIVLLAISYFFNRFYQMLLFVVFFSFIQGCFKYRFHADTIEDNPIKAMRLCKLITIIIEFSYLILCKDLDISLYSNIFTILFIACMNCLLEFVIRKSTVKLDDLKDKNRLLELCTAANLTVSATNRMIAKYIENKTYQQIADEEFVDIDTIKKSINRSRNKIFKNQE